MTEYICHSGGCPGADMTWENEGSKYGVKTIAYSFQGHTQYGKNQKILTMKELEEGYEHVLKANLTMKREMGHVPRYMKGLLARNWFQVKNSEAIFAVGKLDNTGMVNGGTGWAVQMAIDNKKPIYFFDQTPPSCDLGGPVLWTYFDYGVNIFVPLTIGPKLTENFAGIGTRALNEYGKSAIENVYRWNL